MKHYNPIEFLLRGEQHMTISFKKGMVFAVIVLFVGAVFIPSISGNIDCSSQSKKLDAADINTENLNNELLWSLETVDYKGYVGR